MEDFADSSLLGGENGSAAMNTLERATLTRRPRNANNAANSEIEVHPKVEMRSGNEESTAFWVLIVILLILAGGNLSLTFFAMGVLRLGTGMESIEFIPRLKTTKFYGMTDLGNILKKDGIILTYADTPLSIVGDNSKVSLSLRTKSEPPAIEVGPANIEMRNVEEFKVINPDTGRQIFSTKYPNFGLPRGVKNLNVKRTRTSRITSPTFSDLEVRSDSTIRLKGNEGLRLDGKKLTWAADQDIYLKTLNGSIVLYGGAGIFVEVNTLPLVDETHVNHGRGQYKLCVCLPKGQLYRVPVPADNNERTPIRRITCASFSSPCSRA